ncbi:NOL1/NOP2/SUN domain family protein [Megalodesulfovibrio gigas]|uniref:Putative NOL1/NOP2/sun family protein n=1 Tax=Megalodesulfovibrio gigas (strain ATCC 19364 / DSM 1382 / NCIMB 9332 / VKM B-1759) TaxID=1121448 RepID=T2G9D9_MEGG1|nr:RsmB/NOP family class I SAM-dependent RNA methyltransferase [Megalodesulfovibrio gigas]AGW12903.1 putative NOL1/NOP2/sun family protein [Megalodesulfovibrio gigas DSM 1382 = ATCC 19364]
MKHRTQPDTDAPGRTFRFVGPAQERAAVAELLAAEGLAWESLPLHPVAARALTEPIPLGRTLAARFGRIYIQDASSMLPPVVLAPPPGAMVLDMCSSPGSKTGLLSELVGPAGCVVANEPNPERLATLRRTLLETQRLNVVTCRHEGQSLPLAEGFFTHIQCDPPCSGWGTVEKHPKVAALWRGDKVAPLVGLQRLLLREAARLLAPGGRLVYSTCTTNVEENERQVAWALEQLPLELVPVDPPPGFVFKTPEAPFGPRDCLLVDGEESRAQGFFLACFTKPGEMATVSHCPSPPPGQPVDADILRAAGADPDAWDGEVYDFSGSCHFLPRLALERLAAALRWQGVPVGRLTAKGLTMHPRAWGLIPRLQDPHGQPMPPRVQAASLAELTGLFEGRAMQMPETPAGKDKTRAAGLWYGDLALGWLHGKGSRALWTGR